MNALTLTPEQRAIIASTGDIKINAVAGSGKTTTVIEYAKSRPASARILYLAFNKTVKLEAIRKFQSAGLLHVDVETAHSLAYRETVRGSTYQVHKTGYKTREIAEILGLKNTGEKHGEFILANHVNRLVAYFCNSSAEKVQDLNYLDIVSGEAARKIAQVYGSTIVQFARVFLQKMNTGEIEITHDFYLKKFQLSNPRLPYDYILFDEGQDASPAMLSVFLKQPATKVIVGDRHQQIYSWRFAVNSLEQVSFTPFNLSSSFRFRNDIAHLAMQILGLKNSVKETPPTLISGAGGSTATKSKAVLARTNLGLLLKAIEIVTEKRQVKKVYFEGNISSYTYAEDGASLYDVLNLSLEKRHSIKDPLITRMKDMAELEEYIDKTEDKELGMMVEIVREYGSRIPAILQSLKEKHVPNEERDQADMIFSTVHRCKGMEYDSVHLADDFVSEKTLPKLIQKASGDAVMQQRLLEEINLLYVAVTRTRNALSIPEELVPESVTEADLAAAPTIHVLKAAPKREFELETTKSGAKTSTKPGFQRKFEPEKPTFSKTTGDFRHAQPVKKMLGKSEATGFAYQPWSASLDEELTELYSDGTTLRDLAAHFGRSRGAIRARILKLGLEEEV